MTINLGDVNVGVTLNFKFTTVDDTGAPATLAGTPAISVYKDNSVTQSTAGVTLTADFDGVTGLNHVTIDLSADGTFYAAASEFDVVITTGTVDSVSVVGYTVAHFSVQNRVVDIARWLGTVVATPTVAGVPEVDLTHINGGATSGNNATLNLAQLNIVNSGGSAIVASSTGSNGHGLDLSGNGSGHGLNAAGGATGHGISGVGGATSGDGLNVGASPGADGNGLVAGGRGTGRGIFAVGNNAGAGIYAISGSGRAVEVTTVSGNNHGISVFGVGAGHGISIVGGDTGNGLHIRGGATSGNGIDAAAPTSGDGMRLTGAGGGLDLNATTTDALEVTTTNVTAPALATFFTVDSGETYGTAIPGSVVKETADNVNIASIAAGVLNDIADAILRRDWTAVAAPASRSVMNALRAIRNRVRIAGGTLTIYEEDDATPAYTATVTTDAAADPITEIDPT